MEPAEKELEQTGSYLLVITERAVAAETALAQARIALSDARDQLQRGVPIGVEMAAKILDAALSAGLPEKEPTA